MTGLANNAADRTAAARSCPEDQLPDVGVEVEADSSANPLIALTLSGEVEAVSSTNPLVATTGTVRS